MSEGFTATQMHVQLLGNGDAILFSVSKTPDMNVNFVVGASEFAAIMRELIGKASAFPGSPLERIGVFRRKKEEVADPVAGDS